MSIVIDFIDETSELSEEDIQTVEKLLQFAAKSENVEDDSELSVTFVTNERIQEINKEYRNKDLANRCYFVCYGRTW